MKVLRTGAGPFPLIWTGQEAAGVTGGAGVSGVPGSLRGLRLQHGPMGRLSGGLSREAWRLALFGVLSPLGRLVEAELQEKLEDTVTLSWQELRASDLSGPGAGLSVDGRRRHGGS